MFQNMPGLQSFCVAVAIGLGSIYILQVIFALLNICQDIKSDWMIF